ncbi:MAG: RDD family protein [Acidimicrobiales bacterium]
MSEQGSTPPGWYHAPGDPEGTQRYWDGSQWTGEPQPVASAPPAGGVAPPPAPGAAYPGAAGSNPEYDPQLGVTLANPGMRIVARFIDGLIMGVVSFIIGLAFGLGSIGLGGDYSFGAVVIVSLISAAIYFGYEYLMLNSSGATLGKMAFGFKVIREDGQALDSNSTMMRAGVWGVFSLLGNVLPIIGSLLSLAFVVVCIVFLFSKPRHQDVPDLVAKTVVITTR